MFTFKIALRYLFSKKSHKAVNIIAAISIAGVAVATAAIVIVLSVFNGFTSLSERQLSLIDPELLVKPRDGKVFARSDSVRDIILTVDGVTGAVATLSDRGLLVSEHSQTPVEFKGIDDGYCDVVDLDSVVIDGLYLSRYDSLPAAQISVGVANSSGLRPSPESVVGLYVPRRVGRLNPANPAASFRGRDVVVTAVTSVNQTEYDNDRIFVPLDVARDLLDYSDGEASALELRLAPEADIRQVTSEIAGRLDPGFDVLDRARQQSESFRMIAIEKWITFLMLVFILIIASFNILSTLSLLVIEKRDNMTTLRALGATRADVRSIFVRLDWLICGIGGAAGIVVGLLLSLAQQHFGLIRLSGDPAALTIDVYPVAVDPTDLPAVAAAIILIALLTSLVTRLFTKDIK